MLADPCARLDDREGARGCTPCSSLTSRLYAQAPVEAIFGAIARGLGVLATTMRRYDDAERHFEVAIEIEQRMRACPWLAHAQHELGAMLLARGANGDSERALALLEDALATYSELGMDAWATRVEALAVAAR